MHAVGSTKQPRRLKETTIASRALNPHPSPLTRRWQRRQNRPPARRVGGEKRGEVGDSDSAGNSSPCVSHKDNNEGTGMQRPTLSLNVSDSLTCSIMMETSVAGELDFLLCSVSTTTARVIRTLLPGLTYNHQCISSVVTVSKAI